MRASPLYIRASQFLSMQVRCRTPPSVFFTSKHISLPRHTPILAEFHLLANKSYHKKVMVLAYIAFFVIKIRTRHSERYNYEIVDFILEQSSNSLRSR